MNKEQRYENIINYLKKRYENIINYLKNEKNIPNIVFYICCIVLLCFLIVYHVISTIVLLFGLIIQLNIKKVKNVKTIYGLYIIILIFFFISLSFLELVACAELLIIFIILRNKDNNLRRDASVVRQQQSGVDDLERGLRALVSPQHVLDINEDNTDISSQSVVVPIIERLISDVSDVLRVE